MPMDSDMQAVLDQFAKFNAPPIETLSVQNARNNPTLKNAVEEMASHSIAVRTLNAASSVLPETVERVEHILIPTRNGDVSARVYAPKSSAAPLPVIVYFHGGGWRKNWRLKIAAGEEHEKIAHLTAAYLSDSLEVRVDLTVFDQAEKPSELRKSAEKQIAPAWDGFLYDWSGRTADAPPLELHLIKANRKL